MSKRVPNDFSCNSNTHVHGDVTVSGNAYLTNKFRIDANLHVGGTVTMDSTQLIAGDVDAVGAVRFQSSAKVIRRATESLADAGRMR